MIPCLRRSALLLPLPVLVGCGSVLGYADDYALNGQSGASGAGASAGTSTNVGGASGGSAGTSNGGRAGTSSGGRAGTSSGGSAGTSTGGSAGTSSGGGGSGGSAGQTNGGNGGSGSAGNAGASTGGSAGQTNGGGDGGSSGQTSAGNGGSESAGSAGISSAGAGGTSSGGTGGTSSGGQGGSGGAGTSGAGGATTNPTDCSVIYVSPTGKTDDDGCSPTSPRPNLASALVAASPLKTKEIRICEGTYTSDTSTVLARDVSVRGSYRCGDWSLARDPDGPPLTKLVSTGDSPPLGIKGAEVRRSTVIEGIYFQGRAAGPQSRGLSISGGAAPTIQNNWIEARDAKSIDTPASVALVVEGFGTAPRIAGNVIRSGMGDATGSTVASAGAYLEKNIGGVELSGNVISAGDAILHVNGVGSVGIYVEALESTTLAGANALRDNIVTSGLGVDVNNTADQLSIGIFFDETSEPRGELEIVGGVIIAGRAAHGGATPPNVYPSTAGIYSGNHLSLLVDHVRIYGGDASSATGTSQGIQVGGTGSTTIQSSLVHAGGAIAGVAATRFPRAVESHSSGALTITASTLLSGIPGEGGGAIGVYASKPGTLTFRNNLFVLQAGFAVGVDLSGACAPPANSSLIGNGFVQSRDTQVLFEGSSSAGSSCMVSDTKLTSFANRFPIRSANVRALPNPKEASDLAIGCGNTDASCLQAVFTSYDASDGGRGATITPGLGAFTPTLCRLAKAQEVSGVGGLDLVGFPYPDARPSLGALQAQITTACP